jgi:type VI secretion system protein ImpG
MQQEFLDVYNEELRFLRESGDRFARVHPQVARHLGMHGDGIQDPFVERLLEGTAFLTARIQQRLDTEQATFAAQMLARLSPGWMAPTPAIATVAVEPDFTSPQWTNGATIPRGTPVTLSDESLQGGSALLSTCRDIRLFPLEIEHAACSVAAPTGISDRVARALRSGEACLHLRLTTRGVVPLNALGMASLPLTFAGDAVRANQLLTLLSAETLGIVVWCDRAGDVAPLTLPPSAVRIIGMSDEEALLPTHIGELPGMRLLREYFAAPSRYYGVQLQGLEAWLASCEDARCFNIAFVLRKRPTRLLDRIGPEDFRLFASPAINLHRMRCSPLQVDMARTEQHVVVDRLRPDRYEIHHLQSVRGIDRHGRDVRFEPMHAHASYGAGEPAPLYQSRRRRNPAGTASLGGNALNDEVFVALTAGASEVDIDEVSTLLIEAMVCQRDLNPAHLQDPRLSLDMAVPVRTIDIVRTPSQSRPAPDETMAWHALRMVNEGLLRHALPAVDNCAAVVHDWLETFADVRASSDCRRIESIARAVIEHRFERHRGPGPLAWIRSAHLSLDIRAGNHADAGAFLFGEVIRHAMAGYCDLNQSLSTTLKIDGDVVAVREMDHAG